MFAIKIWQLKFTYLQSILVANFLVMTDSLFVVLLCLTVSKLKTTEVEENANEKNNEVFFMCSCF